MDKHIEELDRQEFETWFISLFHPHHMNRNESGSYYFIDANVAWTAWQERGKALLAKLEAAETMNSDVIRDANRYRFLRDEDSWGEDSNSWDVETRTGLISSENLMELRLDHFDTAIDARMLASDIPFLNPVTSVLSAGDSKWKQRAEAAEKEIADWRSIAEAAAQDDADWHKLADKDGELICKMANAIIAVGERAKKAEKERDEAIVLNKHLDLSVRKGEVVNTSLRERAEKAEAQAESNALEIRKLGLQWSRAEKAEKELEKEGNILIDAMDSMRQWKQRAEAAEARLLVPVEFPDCDIGAVSHMAHWYSEKQCEAWVAGVEFSKKQIIKAGFKVEGNTDAE